MGKIVEGQVEFHVNVFSESAPNRVKCPPNYKPTWLPEAYPTIRHPCETAIICQGFAISELWCMTAAHCFRDNDVKKMSIGHGSRNRDLLVHHAIKYVIIHQRFNDQNSRNYDIALVRLIWALEKLTPLHPLINIEQLPRNFEAYMYSRGKPTDSSEIPFPDLVRYIKIQDNRRNCELEDEIKNTDITLCYYLISIEDSTKGRFADSFPGDSGAPIIATDTHKEHKKYLIGMHTRRDTISATQGEYNRAGVNVASYIEWIYHCVNLEISEVVLKAFGYKYRCCSEEVEKEIAWTVPLKNRQFLNISIMA